MKITDIIDLHEKIQKELKKQKLLQYRKEKIIKLNELNKSKNFLL